LRRELGGTPPPSFATLDAEQLQSLTDKLATASEHQRQALNDAIDHGLDFVPRLLRGSIKKALFG